MFTVGSLVRVTAPFNATWPDPCEIVSVETTTDDHTVYVLRTAAGEDIGAFDEGYLEAA